MYKFMGKLDREQEVTVPIDACYEPQPAHHRAAAAVFLRGTEPGLRDSLPDQCPGPVQEIPLSSVTTEVIELEADRRFCSLDK